MRFRFSGGQTEDCLLLAQALPVHESTRYRFQFEYRTEDLAGFSGLLWRLDSALGRAGAVPEMSPDLTASPTWKTVEMTFQPRQSGLAALELRYHRHVGTARSEGSVVLRHLDTEVR